MFTFKVLISILVIYLMRHEVQSSRVYELSDRFVDIKSEGMWYVDFYAPYCGYCKKLEPIWMHVAQSLYNTNIRVGKVDCTRFKSACKSFKIQGYPTIIFFRGVNEFVFNGERTKDELVHFALRMSGPPVQQVTRVESFEILKANNAVFFVYVGIQSGPLWDYFYIVSENNQPYAYFYSTSHEVGSKHFEIEDKTSTIIVFKENFVTKFQVPEISSKSDEELSNLNQTLHTWVCQEKFLTFPKITLENLYQYRQTRKYLVLAVVEENKLNELITHEQEFRDMVESIIKTKREKYHKDFQFGWIGASLAHSIASAYIKTPNLIVLNSTTHYHHMPDDDPIEMTADAVEVFLEAILDEAAPSLGGDHYHIRIKRALFDLRKALYDMFRGNPVLLSVIFGLPLGFLSMICYSIFCSDILDADDEDEHEKKE